jgi:hypothetical protein
LEELTDDGQQVHAAKSLVGHSERVTDQRNLHGTKTVNNYWTNNGTAISPINSFGGITNQGNNNPINPALGPVFFGNPFAPDAPITSLDLFADVTPYGFVTSGGIPIGANDFHFAAHIDLASVPPIPLPGALPLFATGLGALGLLGWRRKKKRPSV